MSTTTQSMQPPIQENLAIYITGLPHDFTEEEIGLYINHLYHICETAKWRLLNFVLVILGENQGWCTGNYTYIGEDINGGEMPIGNGCTNWGTTIKFMKNDTQAFSFSF